MLNQFNIVGRVVSIMGCENNSYATITLAVPRSYKNMNGEYDTDFIPVKVRETVAQKSLEYIASGDIVGVRGRIESENNNLMVVCEKLTFLSSRLNREEVN